MAFFGGLTAARWIHRVCGVALMLVFVYHLGYLLVRLVQRVRQGRRSGQPESVWRIVMHSPMFIDMDDIRGFLGLFGYLLRIKKERPRFGYMNLTQKFEYWAVFWGTPILGFTGLLMWGTPYITEYVSGRSLNFAFIVHSDEAYLAFIYIAVVHMYGVFFSPVVFPMSLGTLTGQAPARELAEGHVIQVEAAARKLNVQATPPPPRRGVAWLVQQIVRRTYAAGMACVCFVLAFISLRFLVGLLIGHEAAPIHITDIPKRLDAATLAAAPPEALRNPVSDVRPRGPLAHFHQIPEWYQPDPGNTCATAGCHPALPHGERIEVRAFLNMHATFLDCTVCHVAQHDEDTAHWISLPEREIAQTPAVLRLAELLAETGDVGDAEARALSARLETLLSEALAEAGRSDLLSDWLLRLQTIHPQGVLFRALLAEMRRGIQLYMHGSYAAKIAFFSGGRLSGTPDAEQRAAISRFLRVEDAMSDSEREQTLDVVHAGLTDRGPLCAACHTAEDPMLDFAALGYPQARIAEMRDSLVVQQIISIEQGQEFHLPRIVETTNRAGD